MAKKNNKRPQRDPEQAGSPHQMPIPAKLHLRGIHLIESSCKLGEVRVGELPGHASQTVTVTLLKSAIDSSLFAVRLGINLVTSYDEDKTKEPAMAIFAHFAAHYAVEEILDQAKIENILQQMAIHHLWPYWREFAQSTSVRMGFPPFPVPLMVVKATAADEEEV